MHRIKHVITISCLVFLVGCLGLSHSEIKKRSAVFSFPEPTSAENTVLYFISPPGWHEPRNYYIIENRNLSRKVNFGKYISLKIPKSVGLEFRYRYGSDFSRGPQGEWKNLVLMNRDKADEIFFVRDGGEIKEVAKEKAIEEIILMKEIFKNSQRSIYSEK